MKKIIIGSRRSKLALIYAKKAKEQLLKSQNKFNEYQIEIKEILTKGDEVQDKRLSDLGGKGLFSKNIENELLSKKIDIAVHALKDMPALQTKGLITNCYLERNDPREILISFKKKKLNELDNDSIIGTTT